MNTIALINLVKVLYLLLFNSYTNLNSAKYAEYFSIVAKAKLPLLKALCIKGFDVFLIVFLTLPE